MKDASMIIITILLALMFGYIIITTVKEDESGSPSLLNKIGIDFSKDEYLYKDELLELGYTNQEIKTIEEKFSLTDVSKYLLIKKYDNMFKYKESKYFNIANLDRYDKYYEKNIDTYDQEETVKNVELGLDSEFYTNIKPADTTKGITILVNKYYYITDKYTPNLVSIADLGWDGRSGGQLDADAASAYRTMFDSAKNDGYMLYSVSAYRSYETQKNLYNNYVKKDGQAAADTYSARPGHSEHNTGLGIDIITASSSKHFENTNEYLWLLNNSWKYGFILRYPKGKEYITGYKFEPWHFRFIGVEEALKFHNLNSSNDLTYEEYLLMTK